MATARELRNKIRSVKNTRKITRTMEMIATAKARVCQKRIEAVKPYGDKIAELLGDLKRMQTGGESATAGSALLRVPEKISNEVVVIVTANRGLCGGYNTNTLKTAERYLDRRQSEGVGSRVVMLGKKGVARFKYTQRAIHEAVTHFDDKPGFAAAEALVAPLLAEFESGAIDALTVVSTRYLNAARQAPEVRPLLPLTATGAGDAAAAGPAVDFILEPSPEYILKTLLPLSLKTQFFLALVEAAASEQIARRIAMKNATDSADDMARSYTQLYNRTRQAGITQEILEVIGGTVS
ncbi:MAG: ATP synthase F1 subunit gamma [Planctomycetota bacterium]